MSFQTSAYLRKATSRGTSDVANKLVSMYLHGVSRRISGILKVGVSDKDYAIAVETEFGNSCCYCDRPLEKDRAAVEHLDGMNRFQVGLHIPGNVVVACKKCNGEKRRDDQTLNSPLAPNGWEAFLCHDSMRCNANCNTCKYWVSIWPDQIERTKRMSTALLRITAFRARYPGPMKWCQEMRSNLRHDIDRLYRDCQEFATARIRNAVDQAVANPDKSKTQAAQ
jgi:hypothetical protein